MTKRYIVVALVAAFAVAAFAATSLTQENLTKNFRNGMPHIQSFSVLEFGPDGILFVGDAKTGAVFAVDTGDRELNEGVATVEILDIEAKIAALVGARGEDIMIHDMAVNPISQNIYVSVSRGRAKWESGWTIPNDVDDANILLKIDPAGEIHEVSMRDVSFAKAELPNPVDMSKEHKWKEGTKLRVDAITDVVYADGRVYVTGLSNEEFASTIWQMPFPFDGDMVYTTVEIFHGAHGEYETHAPVRAFVPYELDGEMQLLAAYLCTPLVTISVEALQNGEHVKGVTVAEFGSGNYPMDMVVYNKGGKDRIVMANSYLPLLIFDPSDVAEAEAITAEVEGYTAGVDYEVRAGSGILQLDAYNAENVVVMQRMPSGTMRLRTFSISRL